jgi:sugar phosphate isomerase/epimerase
MRALGLWWGTVEGADIAELAAAARAAGAALVSISPPMYAAARAAGTSAAELRRVLADQAVSVAMIDPLIRALPGSPSPDQVARRFRATFEADLEACLAAAHALGARAINLAHYLCAPVPQPALADAIGAIARRAAREALEIWIEFMPDGGIPDLATAAALAREVGAPNVGLTLDTWHFFRTGEGLDALAALPAGTIRALQAADAKGDLRGTGARPPTADRLLPGAGVIPLREILRTARANCPSVAIGAEVFDRAQRSLAARDRACAAIGALRRLLD